jgi:hypothetical protein
MATTTLTIGNEVLSTTMYVVMKEWRDALHESVAFCEAQERIHGAGSPSQPGGSRIIQPIGMDDHSQTTELSTGYEAINLAVRDVFVPAEYQWAFAVRPVAISSVEEFVNQGQSAVIKILDGRTKQVAAAMKRDWVEQIVRGGVTGWSRWNTLNGVDPEAFASAEGFLEEDAVGTQTNSVGGVSKTTYSDRTGWQNQIVDGANSFNANGLAALYDLKVETKAVSPNGDINVWLASRPGFKNLKRALQAQERYVNSVGDGGKLVEYWDGVMIDCEFNMPDSGTVTATTPISFYGLNLNNIYVMWDPQGYFNLSPFETVSGEYEVRSAKLRVNGQLIGNHLGSSGLAHSLDTF